MPDLLENRRRLAGTRDHRKSPRLPTRCTAVFPSADDPLAPPVAVELHDISATGVGFTANQWLTLGQRVVLEIKPTEPSAQPLRFEAVVVWGALDVQKQRCRVGCRWLKPLTENEFSQLV